MKGSMDDLSSPGSEGDPVRRLLVISYHFPPDGAVGGLRWEGLSRQLARMGWEVHVVTASENAGNGGLPGLHVHVCARARTLNDVYNDMASRRKAAAAERAAVAPADGSPSTGAAGGNAAGEKASEASPPPRRTGMLAWLRNELGASLAFPDYSRGWTLRAARCARKLLAEREFDAVVTSGPPHACHLAGVLATAGRPGLLHVDMRDPWSALSNRAMLRRFYNSGLAYLAIPWLERLVLRRAVRAIANTSEFAAALRSAYPGLNVSFIPNGIDTERLPPPAEDVYSGLSIAYVGTLYLGRDLSPVLEATRRFLERRPEARAEVRIRVAGHLVGAHAERVQTQISEAGLEDVVELLGVLPGSEALRLLNRSHLAVVLAQNQRMQVPAKLYECVGLQLPTLVVTESTSAAAGEATRIGGIVREPDDIDGIREVIEELWTGTREVRVRPAAPISYADLAPEVDQLLRPRRRALVEATSTTGLQEG